MKPYAFGIDLGGTTVKCGFFKNDGSLIEKWEIPTIKDNGGVQILPDIAAAIKGKLSERNVSPEDVEGVGIGVPGPVLANGVVNGCVNLGWGVFNVAEELSGLLGGIPVVAANDANVAALGEQWKGGGEGKESVIMVTLDPDAERRDRRLRLRQKRMPGAICFCHRYCPHGSSRT